MHHLVVIGTKMNFLGRIVVHPKTKREVLKVFVKWKKQMENQTDRKINVLHSDHDGEYEDQFLQFIQNNIFEIHITEQKIGGTKEMSRSLLEKSLL